MAQKDFYNIVELSQNFEGYRKEAIDKISKTEGVSGELKIQCSMRLWEMRIQLAMAQQLTMISQHLGAIVGKSTAMDNPNETSRGHGRIVNNAEEVI